MILIDNGLLKLDYSPSTDILEVEYPDLHDFMLSEIRHNINILVDMIRHYDVKRVLLDSTRTVISVSDEESKEVAMYLAAGLMKTRLQKVARVQSTSEAVEKTAQGNMRHIKETQSLPFELQNFTSKTEALEWLKSNNTI